jgi:hypothetical protein
METLMLETFSANTFSPFINSTFRVVLDGSPPIDLILVSATEVNEDYRKGRGLAERTPFSIIFRGPMRPILPQAIYHMEHEGLGPLDIFIVPIGPDLEGMQYEAVFN